MREILIAAVALRCMLFALGADEGLSRRLELVTPLNSFWSVRESLAHVEDGRSPYAGDHFHQSPLTLALFHPILALPPHFSWLALRCFFIALDLAIALTLRELCRCQLAQSSDKRGCTATSPALELEEKDEQDGNAPQQAPPLTSPLLCPRELPSTVAAVCLLNPYSVLTCASLSTLPLAQFALVRALLGAARGRTARATFWLALATTLALHPVLLLPPLVVIICRQQGKLVTLSRGCICIGTFLAWLLSMLVLSAVILGFNGEALLELSSWHFVDEVYGWILRYPDMRPNVGVFWYFFLEIFGRFRAYFALILQAQPFFYPMPLTIRFHHHPEVAAHIVIGYMAVLLPFTSFGDLGFFLPFLIMHPYLLRRFRGAFVIAGGIMFTSCTMPLMLHMWLELGSGNANFFYFQTLAYNMFVSLLVLELLKAAGLQRDAQRRARKWLVKQEKDK